MTDNESPKLETKPLDWTGHDDPENPFNWTLRKKWAITFVAAFATFTTLINGSIITVAHYEIEHDLHTADDSHFTVSYLPVTTWALGGGFFSIIVLPVMEDFGLRPVFLITYLLFLISLIPQAVAKNFATLTITRFFSGGFVNIIANTFGSIVSNIFPDERARTVPMSLFVVSYLGGTSLGPVVGASVLRFLQWRWIFYCQLIWYGAALPVYLLFFAETRGSALLLKRAKNLRKQGYTDVKTHEELQPHTSLMHVLYVSVKRPLFMLTTEPVIAFAALWSGFSFGIIYLFTQSTEQVFAGLYGWDPVQAGWVQGSIVTGELLGFLAAPLFARLYFRSAAHNTVIPGVPIPEARVYSSIVGGFLGVAGGMFVYGWTSYSRLPWIAPAFGLGMVGFGSMLVVNSITDYLTDAYSKFTGSAFACLALSENVFIAFLPFAAQSMYANLGFHWASTLLGILSLCLASAPLLLLRFGVELRKKSPFMAESTFERRVEVEEEVRQTGV